MITSMFSPRICCGLTVIALIFSCSLPLQAQKERKSLLDSDPNVVYLDEVFEKPLELEVIKDAPVFSDKEGNNRLGMLKAGQKVKIEAITEKAYRVRGQGTKYGIAGWVGPWVFKMPSEDFPEEMKKFYARQMLVKKLIDEGKIVMGMNMKEVGLVLGEPTKSTVRRNADGESGSWEFIEYDEVRNYVNRFDPYTGAVYRQLVSVTREEKERTVVEFKDGFVVALEASKSKQADVKIILPQVTCIW